VGCGAVWARAHVRGPGGSVRPPPSFADHDAVETTNRCRLVGIRRAVSLHRLCRGGMDRVVNEGRQGAIGLTQPVETAARMADAVRTRRLRCSPRCSAGSAMPSAAAAWFGPSPSWRRRFTLRVAKAAAFERCHSGAFRLRCIRSLARPLDRLRAAAGRPVAERVRLLVELGAELGAVLDRVFRSAARRP